MSWLLITLHPFFQYLLKSYHIPTNWRVLRIFRNICSSTFGTIYICRYPDVCGPSAVYHCCNHNVALSFWQKSLYLVLCVKSWLKFLCSINLWSGTKTLVKRRQKIQFWFEVWSSLLLICDCRFRTCDCKLYRPMWRHINSVLGCWHEANVYIYMIIRKVCRCNNRIIQYVHVSYMSECVACILSSLFLQFKFEQLWRM